MENVSQNMELSKLSYVLLAFVIIMILATATWSCQLLLLVAIVSCYFGLGSEIWGRNAADSIERADAHAAAPGIWGLGIGAWDLRLGVWDLGSEIRRSEIRGWRPGLGSEVWDLGPGSGVGDLGSGFGIWLFGLGFEIWFSAPEATSLSH